MSESCGKWQMFQALVHGRWFSAEVMVNSYVCKDIWEAVLYIYQGVADDALYLPRGRGQWQVSYKCSLGSWDLFVHTCLAKIAKESHNNPETMSHTIHIHSITYTYTKLFVGGQFSQLTGAPRNFGTIWYICTKHLYLSPPC